MDVKALGAAAAGSAAARMGLISCSSDGLEHTGVYRLRTAGPGQVFRGSPPSTLFVWDPASCSFNAGSRGVNEAVLGGGL